MAIGIKIKKFIKLNYQLDFNLFKNINNLNNKLNNRYGGYIILKVFY